MPLTIQEFEQNLYASGLLTEADVASFRSSLDPPPQSADELAHALVKWKRLTMYQARSIYKGKTSRLIIGDYIIQEELGSGGMGEVFKAVHRRMERVVALKALPEKAFDSPDAIRRFQREVKASAKLQHENIVSALDAGEDNRLQYLVLEYVDGRDLYSFVAKKSVLSVRQATNVVIQVARGLRHAHARGVIHRDIKPSNLLLNSKGVVKILDLGLARFINDDPHLAEDTVAGRLTLPGQMLGTAEYVSPEQAEDTHEADARSDIYSLGCTLHYLLTGGPPFEGASVVALVLAHHNDPIPLLRELRTDTPETLDQVFSRMLAKKPEERFQDMDELITALDGVVRELPKDDALPEDFESQASTTSTDSATLAFESDGGSETPEGSDNGSRPETDGASRHDTRDHRDAVEAEKEQQALIPQGSTRKLIAPQTDLEVARWTLDIGGNVMISVGDFCKRVRSADELPDDPNLRLEAVMLDYNEQVEDDDLARFKALKFLRRIFLHGANVGDRGLKNLRTLRNLEQLSIGQTDITDLGLAYLVTLLNMKQLSLTGTRITDRGLKCLERLTRLRKLALAQTRVSPDGVSQLGASLPKCDISLK